MQPRSHRARVRVSGVIMTGTLAVLLAACAAGAGHPSPSTQAHVPLPSGVVVEVGLDSAGAFYRFTSDQEPDLALAAYTATLEAAGFVAAGSERGWEQFSDGRRTLETRVEPGPPTLVLVRELGTPTAPLSTPVTPARTPTATGPGSPGTDGPAGTERPARTDQAPLSASATPTAPGQTPKPHPTPKATPPGKSDTKPGRGPDPPHGSKTGIGGGSGNGNKPDLTPKPTKSPKPTRSPKP